MKKRHKSEVILDAARSVFFKHGYSAATTDMIQREAGVSKSTVYAYYAGKEALFFTVVETECARFVEKMNGITFRPGYLRETLSAFAHAYLSIILSAKGLSLFRLVVAESARFPQLLQKFYDSGPLVIVSKVTQYLHEASLEGELALGGLSEKDAACIFSTLVRGEMSLRSLIDAEISPTSQEIDYWAQIAVATFMRAYGKCKENQDLGSSS